MVLGTLILLVATMLIAPDTQIGRFLHHLMVERPAAALSRLRFGHVLLAATLIFTIAALYWLLQDDGLRLFAMAGSDIIPWIVTIDVSAYLEVAAAAVLALSASAARRAIRVQLPRWFARGGRREQRTSAPRALKGDNDNDEDSRRLAA